MLVKFGEVGLKRQIEIVHVDEIELEFVYEF
jgi:hypothetical protein